MIEITVTFSTHYDALITLYLIQLFASLTSYAYLRSIPPKGHWFRRYKKTYDSLISEMSLKDMSIRERLTKDKRIIRETSRRAYAIMMKRSGTINVQETHLILLNSMTRAMFTDNIK